MYLGPKNLAERHATELESMRLGYEAGVEAARLEAIAYCDVNKVSLPGWLKIAELKSLRERPAKVRGRTGNWLIRMRHDLIHWVRWDTVCEIREQQKLLAIQVEELRAAGPLSPSALIELSQRHARLKWVGTNLDDACERAEVMLEGCEAAAKAETIKQSYKWIQGSAKDCSLYPRFRLLPRWLLRELGLAEIFPSGKGMKLPDIRTPAL